MSTPIQYFSKDPKALNYSSLAEWKHSIAKSTLEILQEQKHIQPLRLECEVERYFGPLGLEDEYFHSHTPQQIAGHISSLYSAKLIAETNSTELQLNLKTESEDSSQALFVVRSTPGAWTSPSEGVERHIDDHYLGQNEFGSGYAQRTERLIRNDQLQRRWNVTCFRTAGSVSAQSHVHLRFYFLRKPVWDQEKIDSAEFAKVADQYFLKSIPENDREFYANIIKLAYGRLAPAIAFRKISDSEIELVSCVRTGSTHSLFSAFSRCYHSHRLQSTYKQVFQLANGFSLYRAALHPTRSCSDQGTEVLQEENLKMLMSDLSTAFTLPRTSLTPLIKDQTLTVNEHAYAYSAWKFAFHFLARQSAQFGELASILKENTVGLTLLDEIRGKVKKEAYTEAVILTALFEKANIIKTLYKDFAEYHQNGKKASPKDRAQKLLSYINNETREDLHRTIFSSFVDFNMSILKTNFYSDKKVAISYRLDPSFLPKSDYPQTPFGIFFIIGAEFRGFHVRFRDVARGGIRLVRSGNPAAFSLNAAHFFDEVYNLASTQERKNKDIAEGGSKGAILLAPDHQDRYKFAFHKYIDSLLDLLIVSDRVANYLDQEEILFLGPDEGTADLMDFASELARKRGYKYWKAFTTGKSPIRGGIPHDTYGMTTRSVHQYVLGILEKLGLQESQMTKIQTGGPDGDLGSNEIKISKDKTIAVVDGSGVLYDPAGIDRPALTHLAEKRVMTCEFPTDKLSPQGFFVSINDTNRTLPDGTHISNGTEFRNTFHICKYAKADMFVPCGGRPESINLSNVNKLFDSEKNPHWKIIVEGANLFITQQARVILENAGVILIKDASANKGGVTSSSLEVQAALALTDEEFETNMSVKDSKNPPSFYINYKNEVQDIIEKNAAMEFKCIWSESLKSDTPKAILSDHISNKINELSLVVGQSSLWDNISLRRKVLEMNTPKTIIKLVGGIDELMKRMPENYLRAVFSCTLSSHYVYSEGLTAIPEFSFYNFISKLL